MSVVAPPSEASPPGSTGTARRRAIGRRVTILLVVLIAVPIVLSVGLFAIRDLTPSGPTAISPVGRHLVGTWIGASARISFASDHSFVGAGRLPGDPGCRPARRFSGTWQIDSTSGVTLDYGAPCSTETNVQVEQLGSGRLALFYFVGDPDEGDVVMLVSH